MKKEGTGKPRNPDVEIDAGVKVSELRFEKVPESEVCFRGSTRRNSVWGSRRDNLPEEVQEGVVYRDAGARLRIASEIVGSDSNLQSVSDEERAGKGKHKFRESGRATVITVKQSLTKRE